MATAIPEIEEDGAEEADVVLLYVDGCAESRGCRCEIVGAGVANLLAGNAWV